MVSYIRELRHVYLFLEEIMCSLCVLLKWASRAFHTASRLLWTCWHFIYLKPLPVHSSWTMEQAYQAFLVRVSLVLGQYVSINEENRNWRLEVVNVLAIYWRKLARTSLASLTFEGKKSPGLPLRIRVPNKTHENVLLQLDCKTVRIFAYSSKREQSNKRSGTRLKTESETGERR